MNTQISLYYINDVVKEHTEFDFFIDLKETIDIVYPEEKRLVSNGNDFLLLQDKHYEFTKRIKKLHLLHGWKHGK